MAKKLAPAKPTQRILKLAADPDEPGYATVPVKVEKTTAGPVSFFQKLAGYYKGAIAVVGFLAATLASPQVGALNGLLPPEQQKWLSLAIGIVTVVGVVLKENEHWFEDNQVT